MDISHLHNIYFGLRHGESEANVIGIIAAGNIAREQYGLTQLGVDQVTTSVAQAQGQGLLGNNTIIVTSPLKRAYQTAVVTTKTLRIPAEDIIVDERLRERSFGKFEGESHSAYREIIWPADRLGQEGEHGVETTQDVKNRVLALIEELEEKFTNAHIVLVSHGDTLQILETCFEGISPREHRSLPHLGNGEIRKYN